VKERVREAGNDLDPTVAIPPCLCVYIFDREEERGRERQERVREGKEKEPALV